MAIRAILFHSNLLLLSLFSGRPGWGYIESGVLKQGVVAASDSGDRGRSFPVHPPTAVGTTTWRAAKH